MTTWFISDTHFGHANIIRLCGRPFASVAEMDAVMIERWNAAVKPNDEVWHLGDVYYKAPNPGKLFAQLNGNLNLILGNHDKGTDPELWKAFRRIESSHKFKIGPLEFIASHCPLHADALQTFDETPPLMPNVHGHIHERNLDDPLYVNISVEQTNYAPLSFDELEARIARRADEFAERRQRMEDIRIMGGLNP